jgi:hypothetical protein
MNEADRKTGIRLQNITDPKEMALANQLNSRLDLVEPLLDKWNKVAAVQIKPGSQMAVDDEFSAWRQLSHTVVGGLHLALDNMRAFRNLVRPDSQLLFPQFAHYPLLRASLEGGSLALWLLSPADPKDRILRLLRTATAELQDEDTLANQIIRGLTEDPDRPMTNAAIDRARKHQREKHRKHAAQIRSVAIRLGIEDPTAKQWGVSYAEIVRDATAAVGIKSYYGETMWRMISGLAHPSLLRATTRSNVEEVTDNGDGTFNALVTTDLGLTRTSLEAAWLAANAAVDLIGERKIRPANRADYIEDASVPFAARPTEQTESAGDAGP